MSDAAIIQATFSEWRMIKGRKVLQIICEVPLEAQGAVFGALGAPMPDSETWVAIARLRGPQRAPEQLEEPKRRSLAQRAGILCNEQAFNRWAEENGYASGKDYIYDRCTVTSRADLDKDSEAGQRFRDMAADYQLWLSGVAA